MNQLSLVALLCSLFVPYLPPARADDALLAVFDTTLGSFTVEIDYTNAPLTSANFVSLAEGSRSWMHPADGFVSTNAYYDHLVFHRVSNQPGLQIVQGGCPLGNGQGGPGYTIRDEFTGVHTHDTFGTLSMAHSGPHTGGSQFFITIGPNSHLNGIHATFGHVVQGSNVLQAIGDVPVDGNLRPLEDITILRVTIERRGAAALFDVEAQHLPEVRWRPIRGISPFGEGIELEFERDVYRHTRVGTSYDLDAWTLHSLEFFLEGPVPDRLPVTTTDPKHFFRACETVYPPWVPATQADTRLLFFFTNEDLDGESMEYILREDMTGTYDLSFFGDGNVPEYLWQPAPPHAGQLYVAHDQIVQFDYGMSYNSATGGTFRGIIHIDPPMPTEGAFLQTPAAPGP